MRTSFLIACLVPLVVAADAAAQHRCNLHAGPCPVGFLVASGYDTTPDGLVSATQSEDTHVIRFALQYAAENADPALIDEAERLMVVDSGPMVGGKAHPLLVAWARLEAAKYLATFDQESGLEWLHSWGTRIEDDHGLDALNIQMTRVALDSAMFLAEHKNDESLVHLLPFALSSYDTWSVRNHVARALGSFQDLSGGHLEETWLLAAQLVPEALDQDPAISIFIGALIGSARKQAETTQAVVDAFDALAEMELNVTIFREDIRQQYPIVETVDSNAVMRKRLEWLRDILTNLPLHGEAD